MSKNPMPAVPKRLQRELHEAIHLAGVTYAQQWVWCGKRRCRKWHGPYWYAHYWTPGGRRPHGHGTRSKYVGKELPESVVDEWRMMSTSEREVAAEVARAMRSR